MNKINLDKILDIVNEWKIRNGLENYVPLYPMLRVENNKLYIVVMLVKDGIDVWNSKVKVVSNYWCKIDIRTLEVIEFNELEDIYDSDVKILDEDNDIKKLIEKKRNQYKEYLINDVINTVMSSEGLLKSLNNEIIINDEKMGVKQYLTTNIESVVDFKVKEFVDMLIQAKYSLMLVSYDNLFDVVRNRYLQEELIIEDKIKLCMEIMINYYSNVLAIDKLFNV